MISATYRAQADALETEAQAKRRLADEYDAAQERGEVRKAGNPNFSVSEKLGSAKDAIPPKVMHEACIIRDAHRPRLKIGPLRPWQRDDIDRRQPAATRVLHPLAQFRA